MSSEANDANKRLMPHYEDHNEVVGAIRIVAIVWPPRLKGPRRPYLRSSNCISIRVAEDYLKRFSPLIGGYYVLHKDGHESYSPAEAFEAGYTLIEGEQT